MANNLNMKYTTGENLLSLLSQVTTSLNNKINNIPNVEINNNGNFEIKGVDTNVKAKGQDGKTLTGIECDKSNNIIITSSDGTTSNVGNLNTTVSGGIASEDGLGEVRYYNNKFQYKYNNNWVDMVVTDDNKIIKLLTPQPMRNFKVFYDSVANNVSLTLLPPLDTTLNKNVICYIEKVVVRRKKDSIPTDVNDGEEVLVLTREHFKDYKTNPYIDETFQGAVGETWYYGAFPVSKLGLVNLDCIKKIIPSIIYGFTIDQNESDPSSMITYIENNIDYKPVYMNYSSGIFDYGDWKNVWFIKNLKPVMLNYDGTVAYELDKNDYTKKKDGSDSDITDTSFEGNVMIGIPKVYYKIVDNGDETANVYFSEYQVDNDYHCWSHLDNDGKEISYCYMSAYESSLDTAQRLRSISGLTPSASISASNSMTYAKNNHDDTWNIGVLSDRMLINLLLILISRNTNTQKVFGNGNSNSSAVLKNGTLDQKGMFYGYSTTNQAVKVFGIENYWGNLRKWTAGYISGNSKNALIKMTYSQTDGSDTIGYNTDGTGYISVPQYSENTARWIKKMYFSPFGFFPKDQGSSSTTYYCDVLYGYSNYYASLGGSYLNGSYCGAFDICFYYGSNSTDYNFGAGMLSCKPSLATQTSQS